LWFLASLAIHDILTNHDHFWPIDFRPIVIASLERHSGTGIEIIVHTSRVGIVPYNGGNVLKDPAQEMFLAKLKFRSMELLAR
jgi:hypothetical protein